MGKIKISKKRKASALGTLTRHEPDTKLLRNKKLIIEVLVDALLQNDLETFRDVLVSHLRSLSKTDLAKQTGLGRRTLYDLMEHRNFDPRLSTISSLLSKLVA